MIKLFEFNDCKMFVDDGLIIHQLYLGNGLNYEVHVRREIEKFAPLSTVMWDIGSNAGIHTVSAKQVNPKLTVVCFEPATANYRLLARTIGLNGWKDVYVVPVAVGDHDGLIGINDDPTNPTCRAHGENYANWQPVFRLDSFDLPLPQLVKIDIEGCEPWALKAAEKMWAARPVIISEFYRKGLDENGGAANYIDFIISHGYKVTVLDYHPGQRKVVESGAVAVDYIERTSGVMADIVAEPV